MAGTLAEQDKAQLSLCEDVTIFINELKAIRTTVKDSESRQNVQMNAHEKIWGEHQVYQNQGEDQQEVDVDQLSVEETVIHHILQGYSQVSLFMHKLENAADAGISGKSSNLLHGFADPQFAILEGHGG